jgi:hypothetical protein
VFVAEELTTKSKSADSEATVPPTIWPVPPVVLASTVLSVPLTVRLVESDAEKDDPTVLTTILPPVPKEMARTLALLVLKTPTSNVRVAMSSVPLFIKKVRLDNVRLSFSASVLPAPFISMSNDNAFPLVVIV